MTADIELPAILRDIAAGRRNSVGDYWSRDYCNQAAAEIERLRAEREVIGAEAVKYAEKSGRLEARAERLAEALRVAPGGHSCEEFHHRKSDRHLPGEPCPPQVRWHKALAALRDHDQEGRNG